MTGACTWTRRAHNVIGVNDRVYAGALVLVREAALDNLARTRHSTPWPLASVMLVVATPRFFAPSLL